ncbi:unnamed protein product [Mytilus coruscus]|nr:unnamed protein product [Mytilus coruscus]
MTYWYPKLKPGGLFSGNDYCVNKMDLYKTKDVPWCGIYKPGRDYMGFSVFKSTNITGKEKQSFIGVVKAVRLFARSESIPNVFFTMEERETLGDDGLSSSWYFFKPF